MKHATMILAIVLLFVALYPVTAKPVSKVGEILRLKFAKGKAFFVETTTKTSQKMKVKDTDVSQAQEQTMVIHLVPESQSADGDWLVGFRIVGMRLKIDFDGNVTGYDSTQKEAASPMTLYFDALMKASFKATIGSDGVIRKLDGRDEFINTLKASLPASTDSLNKRILTDGMLKQMIAPIGEFLSIQPERVGKSWIREDHLDLAPIGRYSRQGKLVYHGGVGGVHEVRSAITMKYQRGEYDEARLPFKLSNVKFTTSEGHATYHFDADLGRLKESTLELRLIGSMQIRVGDVDADVDIDQTQTQKIRTLEKNPLSTKK